MKYPNPVSKYSTILWENYWEYCQLCQIKYLLHMISYRNKMHIEILGSSFLHEKVLRNKQNKQLAKVKKLAVINRVDTIFNQYKGPITYNTCFYTNLYRQN